MDAGWCCDGNRDGVVPGPAAVVPFFDDSIVGPGPQVQIRIQVGAVLYQGQYTRRGINADTTHPLRT